MAFYVVVVVEDPSSIKTVSFLQTMHQHRCNGLALCAVWTREMTEVFLHVDHCCVHRPQTLSKKQKTKRKKTLDGRSGTSEFIRTCCLQKLKQEYKSICLHWEEIVAVSTLIYELRTVYC